MIDYNNIIYIKTNSIISFNIFIFIILALTLSLTFDLIFGELPAKIHPVVVIGNLITFFKNIFIKIRNRMSGLLTVISVSFVSSVILYVIYLISSFNSLVLFIVFSILLSSTFSIKMLLQTANDVKEALDNDIERARHLVSYLVSRNTDELTESLIASASIESLTENITDSVVAPIFYYFIFAVIIMIYPFNNELFYLLLIPMLYRISNTLDAMLGYTTDELIDIGYVPAKIDDILNYLPARISGLYVVISAYLLKMDWQNAYRIMKRDARKCPSPNSGYTMAAAAGALNICLVKKDTYVLGNASKDIVSDDISKAVKLSKLTIILFIITVILLLTLFYVIL